MKKIFLITVLVIATFLLTLLGCSNQTKQEDEGLSETVGDLFTQEQTNMNEESNQTEVTID